MKRSYGLTWLFETKDGIMNGSALEATVFDTQNFTPKIAFLHCMRHPKPRQGAKVERVSNDWTNFLIVAMMLRLDKIRSGPKALKTPFETGDTSWSKVRPSAQACHRQPSPDLWHQSPKSDSRQSGSPGRETGQLSPRERQTDRDVPSPVYPFAALNERKNVTNQNWDSLGRERNVSGSGRTRFLSFVTLGSEKTTLWSFLLFQAIQSLFTLGRVRISFQFLASSIVESS